MDLDPLVAPSKNATNANRGAIVIMRKFERLDTPTEKYLYDRTKTPSLMPLEWLAHPFEILTPTAV